jgi:ABC-type phosphate transport system substrate-binding protein
MKTRYLTAIALCMSLNPSPALRADVEAPRFYVIVNASRSVDSLDRSFLTDVFLKRITHWPDDGVIQPVDLRQDSPARQRFSRDVLSRSVNGVKSYWQQRIFSGRDVPPPELPTDDEVVKYVVSNPGSIGYVSENSNAHGVKAITVR